MEARGRSSRSAPSGVRPGPARESENHLARRTSHIGGLYNMAPWRLDCLTAQTGNALRGFRMEESV